MELNFISHIFLIDWILIRKLSGLKGVLTVTQGFQPWAIINQPSGLKVIIIKSTIFNCLPLILTAIWLGVVASYVLFSLIFVF